MPTIVNNEKFEVLKRTDTTLMIKAYVDGKNYFGVLSLDNM